MNAGTVAVIIVAFLWLAGLLYVLWKEA